MTVRIRFQGNLPDLLSRREKREWLAVEFPGKRSVKDLVQSLGIPHTEIGCIRIDNQSRDFTYIPQENDTIEVFPVSAGAWTVPAAQEGPLNNPRFLCDVHLWKLARRLRLLGFDTRFNPGWDDADLAALCLKEHLVLLSRDRGLLKRNQVVHGLLIRDTDPEKQVMEVLQRFGAYLRAVPFSRCLVCNGLLEPVDTAGEFFKKKLEPHIPLDILKWCREFQYCTSCEKTYWKGSHYEKLSRLIDEYSIIHRQKR